LVLRRALLIALSLWLLGAGSTQAAVPGCLRCHPSHYAERGSCFSCHRGDGRSDRRSIAHRGLVSGRYAWFAIAGSTPLGRGEKLAQGFACRRCHRLAGRGNALASDLDRVGRRATPEQLAAALRVPARAMPDFRFTEGQIADLVCCLLAAGAHQPPGPAEVPQLVHFRQEKGSGQNVFDRECGPCHRLLSRTRGSLGQGDAGPNLSGLFGPFYPRSAAQGGAWTRERAVRWLRNPRALRPQTQMPPVALSKVDLERLLALLDDAPVQPAGQGGRPSGAPKPGP